MKSSKLRIVHVASWNGNIGDIANHKGFYNLFEKYVTTNYSVEKIEIRDFYKSWNVRKFDHQFVEFVNSFDVLVFGGGNFFDVKWDYSCTGTTIDLSIDLIDSIRIPIIFNGMGVDFNANSENTDVIKRFEGFLEYCKNHQDKIVVSVRNDDSIQLLNHYVKSSLTDSIIQIPDGGFFTIANKYFHPELPKGKRIIAINVAKDRIIERWSSLDGYNDYCCELGSFINKAISSINNLHFVFCPHIPSDLQAICDVLKSVSDKNCRCCVTIAPYLNGDNTPGDYMVDLYRNAMLTIGMRYHANICSIAMGTPTVGIVSLDKHISLYQNIGMGDRLFNVQSCPFADELLERVQGVIDSIDKNVKCNESLIIQLEKESVYYYERIKKVIGFE